MAPILLSQPKVSSEVVTGSTLELKLEVKEELSGMRRMIAIFTGLDVTSRISSKVRSFEFSNGLDQSMSFNVDENQPEGEYYFRYIFLEDQKKHQTRYHCDLETMKYKGTDFECPVVRVRKSAAQSS